MDCAIVRQRAGETIARSDEKECAWLLIEGSVEARAGEARAALSRASLFDERPSVVHAGPGTEVQLSARSDVEWLLVRASNPTRFSPRIFLPAECQSEPRGKGLVQDACLRVVRLVFDLDTRPESQLVLGEVINLAGRWSSFPPHHHGQPELYHYRFSKPQGYGHAELGDEVLKVKSHDTVKITGAVDHPQVAAPGYGMYYAWIVRHRPNDPYRGFTFAPEHAWILEGRDQG
ncbi:MAG: 5-deoxy-glucuronate isomerase, partial [Deltaproteobacteria bacterium]|nr:5-deoxy-glucuronate isomerase [Deltaproteobacteria bacterium]